jgi:predicted HTH transcriptional regulator
MIELKDEGLLLRLRNFEDNFVERKTSADSKDWLKTVVAFANSTPVGYPAVLFIGVKDDGTPEERTVNLDLRADAVFSLSSRGLHPRLLTACPFGAA